MIEVKTAFSNSNFIFPTKFSLGIYGNAIDERTEYSISVVISESQSSFRLYYNRDELCLFKDDIRIECNELYGTLETLTIDNVIIDSTSLDIPELALIIKALLKLDNCKFSIFYVEPDSYLSESKNSPTNVVFDLSDTILGFESTGIPTITFPVSNPLQSKFLFFAGFEEGRIASAFEVFDINSSNTQIFFGVPAFKPGWENSSFKRNIRTIEDNGLRGRIGYCSASCVSSSLAAIRSTCREIPDSDESFIYLLPLGTKPCSIGAILFSNERMNAALLYDQPLKKQGRSMGVGVRNLYRIVK